jgi:hypothetical protein
MPHNRIPNLTLPPNRCSFSKKTVTIATGLQTRISCIDCYRKQYTKEAHASASRPQAITNGARRAPSHSSGETPQLAAPDLAVPDAPAPLEVGVLVDDEVLGFVAAFASVQRTKPLLVGALVCVMVPT